MKSTKNISNLLRAFAVLVVFTAASCSTQEDFVKPEEVSPLAKIETTTEEAETVASMTVSGEFTEFQDLEDCSTCTFVVAEDATVVDGKDFKPGDVICLNKAFKYKSLEFVNVTGTGENPIVIANCGE